MLIEVWEVYGESNNCIACKSKEFAEHQNVILPTVRGDIVHTKINMTDEEIRELNETGYIWV